MGMRTVLLVSDTASVTDRVHTALAGADVVIVDHTDPETASETAYSSEVDSVVVEMQVGAMGAMAVTRAMRAASGEADPIPVTILLDRPADAFLAGRAGAANWVGKGYTSTELREAIGIGS
jgi:DNA-binding response OmpR family regulator